MKTCLKTKPQMNKNRRIKKCEEGGRRCEPSAGLGSGSARPSSALASRGHRGEGGRKATDGTPGGLQSWAAAQPPSRPLFVRSSARYPEFRREETRTSDNRRTPCLPGSAGAEGAGPGSASGGGGRGQGWQRERRGRAWRRRRRRRRGRRRRAM